MLEPNLVAKLEPCTADLRKLEVESLSIFGSHARGDAREDSDVDVLVKFRGPATFSGYMDLKFLLEDIWGKKVDLVTDKAVRPELRQRIESEAIRVA
jgi:predicted nucleotidyltransferase